MANAKPAAHHRDAWQDPEAKPYIEIQGVTKKFGEFTAVDDVSLNIYQGELFSLLGGLAQSPTQLVIARALQGAGAAMAAPSVLALLTTSAPDAAARNRALALFGAVSSAGATIGLLVGGLVTDVGSWRWTLWINVPIGIAVLVLARRFVTETPRRPGRFGSAGPSTRSFCPRCAIPGCTWPL